MDSTVVAAIGACVGATIAGVSTLFGIALTNRYARKREQDATAAVNKREENTLVAANFGAEIAGSAQLRKDLQDNISRLEVKQEKSDLRIETQEKTIQTLQKHVTNCDNAHATLTSIVSRVVKQIEGMIEEVVDMETIKRAMTVISEDLADVLHTQSTIIG